MPVDNIYGFASVIREFDVNGNCVVERYYDSEGKPTETVDGIAEIRRLFDDNHNKMEEMVLSLDEVLQMNN